MAKLKMLSGLIASGKTTRAKEIVEQGNWVRLNRDLLREMLHFSKFTSLNERATVDAEKALVRYFLMADKNVVVDDCNLNPKNKEMWKTIAKECNAKIEYEFIGKDLSIEELVLRDKLREKTVGGSVIKNMALQYGLQPIPGKGFVIVDLDGTIADLKHRLHFIASSVKDWKGFFEHISEDTLRKDIAKKVIDYYNQMHTIIYVTARPEDYKEITLKWLEKNSMSFGWTLIMRKRGDSRPDTEVKQDMYDTYLKKYPIEVVFDDRPRIINMWKSNGLKVIDCGDGIDF